MLCITGFSDATKYEIEADSSWLIEDDNGDIQIVRDIQKIRIIQVF